jgi:hypothetical protein
VQVSTAAFTGTTAAGDLHQSPPAESEDWREARVAPRIMILLAGRCAEALARRPNRDGWRRRMDERERVANHEAGHLLLAAATRHQNGAAIEMVEGGCRGIAQHYEGAPPDLDHPTFERFDELQRDFVKARDYAKLAVGTRGWLKYLRTLWIRTDAILAEHWICVRMLSLELQHTGVVRRARAQQIIEKFWSVRGDSLVDALTRQNISRVHAEK